MQEPPGQEGLEDDNLPDIFGSSMGGWSSPTSTVAFAMQETEANRFSKHPLTPSDCVGANGFGVTNIVGMEGWEELTEQKRNGTGKIVRHHHAKKKGPRLIFST